MPPDLLVAAASSVHVFEPPPPPNFNHRPTALVSVYEDQRKIKYFTVLIYAVLRLVEIGKTRNCVKTFRL